MDLIVYEDALQQSIITESCMDMAVNSLVSPTGRQGISLREPWLQCLPVSGFKREDVLIKKHRCSTQFNNVVEFCDKKKLNEAMILSECKWAHAKIIGSSIERSTYIGNLLVRNYANCGALKEAQTVFDKILQKNIFSWTAIIAAYVERFQISKVFELYFEMVQRGINPDKVIFIVILQACTLLAETKLIHSCILERKYAGETFVASALINVYGRCGSLENVNLLFDRMYERDLMAWVTVMQAHTEQGYDKEALKLFHLLHSNNTKLNVVSFTVILDACINLTHLAQGKFIHAKTMIPDFCGDDFLITSLVHLYGKCQSVDNACLAFCKLHHPSLMSQNAMISVYSKNGYGKKALELFQEVWKKDQEPDAASFVGTLGCCKEAAALGAAKFIHACTESSIWASDISVQNALIDMYDKCGSLEDAVIVFDNMNVRDLVSWNTIISAHTWNCGGREALLLFWQRQVEDAEWDQLTIITVLNACAKAASLEQCRLIHMHVLEKGLIPDTGIENALINAYGKCGSKDEAFYVFSSLQQGNTISCNNMIEVYTQNEDDVGRILELVQKMMLDGLRPDAASLASVLSSCRHHGAVNEGYHHFICMYEYYGIVPSTKHFGSMISLLLRASYSCEAEEAIRMMPWNADSETWNTLLAA